MEEFLDDLTEMIEKYSEGEIDGYDLGDWVYNKRAYIETLRRVLYDEPVKAEDI